jgi:16S rRNA (adenine(1408)-N(1))-methyltransferase
MIVVRGKKTEVLDAGALAARIAARTVTLDLGAGDGRWAYRRARARPAEFVIALDPVAENMAEASSRAAKKPERGGAPNALFVVGAAESPPEELGGIAGEVFVTLPWGSLMRGIILAEPAVLAGIAGLAAPGARVRIVLNTRIFDDPVPLEARDLPGLTPAYVLDALARPFASVGLSVLEARELTPEEVAALDTTWAKRLSHQRPPPSVYIEAVKAER